MSEHELSSATVSNMESVAGTSISESLSAAAHKLMIEVREHKVALAAGVGFAAGFGLAICTHGRSQELAKFEPEFSKVASEVEQLTKDSTGSRLSSLPSELMARARQLFRDKQLSSGWSTPEYSQRLESLKTSLETDIRTSSRTSDPIIGGTLIPPTSREGKIRSMSAYAGSLEKRDAARRMSAETYDLKTAPKAPVLPGKPATIGMNVDDAVMSHEVWNQVFLPPELTDYTKSKLMHH